ncbi:hypothetical protein TVAG_473870 [Trichomonas vaginalis G3]|uniref:DNA replication complex GINS protein PSF3 N-terminal domain-containing protein n=1 Tax=Trichomonas vaginalis (strain ATCC PRA-98 / G3) TaxID=412133 RepID=A2EQ33_TRIV3|nr:DNA replication [Trichomonas vaginalis G3]EAY05208.1 hypothetical protein TVAG_473870 [Trichomonas vaginalis G3]KAI5542625.1 DNA replication [Trichomonas vaginalis G3]|eukprot:XP_001317431.1 hypothetical protein [Trichomonas vaginalis G3]
MEDVRQFLLEEELVPVVFKTNLEGCGFLVSKEQATADIPEGYKSGLPFWLAKELARIDIVEVEEPRWLAELGPGANITAQRSYLFGGEIAKSRRDNNAIVRLMHLLQSRSLDITDTALKPRNYRPGQVESVYLSEEQEMIQKTQRNTSDFLYWKKKKDD